MKWLIAAAATQLTDTPEENEALPLEATATIEFTTDRDPLENIENTNTVRYVMKNGELFEAATIDGGGR